MALSAVPFHMMAGIANRQARHRGEITPDQFLQMKEALRDPAKCAQLEEAAYNHGTKMNMTGIAGQAESSVNWGSFLDFIIKILPILFQLLPLIMATDEPKAN